MKYNYSFFDYDNSTYSNINTSKSPSKINSFSTYQRTEPQEKYYYRTNTHDLKPKNSRNEDYINLRQTYNGDYRNDFLSSKKDVKQDKFLRTTIDCNFMGIGKNKQQLTGSYVGQWGSSNQKDKPSISFNLRYDLPQTPTMTEKKKYKQSKFQKVLQKANKYDQVDEKLAKSAKIIDQLKKLKDQRKIRIQSKKIEELKCLEITKNEDSETTQKNFSKKGYVQYFTPKFDKANYEERFQQKQNIVKERKTSRTPAKKEKTPNKTSVEKVSVSTMAKVKTIIKQKNIIPNVIQKAKQILSEFTLGKNLGEGKFGNVYVATHIPTNSLYALKKVPKEMIKSHMMVDQFLLEIKLQSFMNHQNILTINGFCDDKQYIYLILEYMEQGTLFKLLKTKKVLEQKEAAIYLKQIARAVQYIHQNGIAHRDIKPQNIVMSNGVCKLCDFGWATVCNQRRKTYCGTFDYAAPQILEGIQYDMSVDLWCLGVLAYQLMVGKAPFYHISRKETMKRILNVDSININYPLNLSRNAVSFIENLIKKNPDERMRSDSLLNHPFLANVQK